MLYSHGRCAATFTTPVPPPGVHPQLALAASTSRADEPEPAAFCGSCNTPHVTCHICNSDSCHFRLCVMIFPSWSGFVFRFAFFSCLPFHIMSSCASHFAYVFISCIRAFSPLSVLQSGAPISSGAPLLLSFVSGCQTFSEWTEACQVALVYHR